MLLGVLAATGLLTACTQPEETLPDSTYADLIAEAEQLAGVTAVTRDDVEVTVTLDPDTDADALTETSDALLTLLTDYRYPEGAPRLKMEAGSFTGQYDGPVHSVPPGVPHPGPLNLGQLPFLASLPDVESGTIGQNRNATVSLAAGTDMRAWMTEAASDERELRLTATRSLTDEEAELAVPVTTDGSSADDPQLSVTVDMTEPGAVDAISRFYDTADTAGALPSSVKWESGLQQPNASLRVGTDGAITDVFDVFSAEYGPDAVSKLSAISAEGLQMSFGDAEDDPAVYFTAIDLLAAEDITVESVALDRGSMTVDVDDGAGLRRFAEVVAGPDWPLAADTDIRVHNAAHPDDKGAFTSGAWPGRVELLADLWDAGFESVRMSTSVGGTGADFSLRVSPVAAQDLSSPDSRTDLIEVLRGTGWQGTALITVSTGGHLTFTATEDGRAKDAYMALAGVDRTPSGWAQDFLDEFDAAG